MNVTDSSEWGRSPTPVGSIATVVTLVTRPVVIAWVRRAWHQVDWLTMIDLSFSPPYLLAWWPLRRPFASLCAKASKVPRQPEADYESALRTAAAGEHHLMSHTLVFLINNLNPKSKAWGPTGFKGWQVLSPHCIKYRSWMDRIYILGSSLAPWEYGTLPQAILEHFVNLQDTGYWDLRTSIW